jgi:hypothetical protein
VVNEVNGTWRAAQQVSVPDDGLAYFTAISCPSAGNCVAGGTLGYGRQAFLVTETGGTWGSPQVVSGASDVDASVTAISCPKIGYCEAGGNYDAQPAGPLPGVGYPFVVDETGGAWGSATPLSGPYGPRRPGQGEGRRGRRQG